LLKISGYVTQQELGLPNFFHFKKIVFDLRASPS
jgi:hypothetical protein